jgi:hypothetical protein
MTPWPGALQGGPGRLVLVAAALVAAALAAAVAAAVVAAAAAQQLQLVQQLPAPWIPMRAGTS